MPSSVIVAVGFVITWLILISIVAHYIRKAGPNEVLIISGWSKIVRREDGTPMRIGFRILKGGATFVWPFIERIDRLSLNVIPVEIKNPDIQSVDGTPVMLDAMAQVRIKSDDVSIIMASQNLLSKDESQICAIAKQIVEGHCRSILNATKIEDTLTNRSELFDKIQSDSETDLNKIGMTLVSFIIHDIRGKNAVSLP
jgi:flotillin